jgi:putative ABC transport system permease protein
MTSVVWKKVWRDLAGSKARTALAALSTAVGVFALGLVFGLSGTMRAQMTQVHQEAIPAHITFWGGPFSPEMVSAAQRERGVMDTQGELAVSFRWKLESDENWHNGRVTARADYETQDMNLLRLVDGQWPTRRRLGIDHLSSQHFGIHPDATILIDSGGRQRPVLVKGVVYAHDVLAPEMGGEVTFFATPETAAWLTNYESGEDFNRLQVRLESFSQEEAEETARRIKARLERIGLSVGGYEITDPDVHFMQDIVDAVLIVLAVMGILSLGLSAFLIVNTMNAIIAGQVWQIGVMKAVGATLFRVVDIYLVTALIYGTLALLLAVPLGAVGAHLVAAWLLDMFNVEVSTFQFVPGAVGIQAAVGVVVPLLAALVPVLGGARVTVRKAISTHGIGGGFGHSWLDRLVGQIRCLPRLIALSLRNTFRRKGRVALTLAVLTFSGAVFTTVMSTGGSFDNTVMIMFELAGDVIISLDRPQRVSRLIEIAEGVPGVARAEVWSGQGATLLLAPSGGEESRVSLRGVPSGSEMFNPRITSGRSLLEGDGQVILVNHRLSEEAGIRVGQTAILSIDGEESEWTVVGTYLSVNSLSDEFFVPFDALARETGSWGKGNELMVLSEAGDVASQQRLIKSLTDALATRHIEVHDTWSASKQWEETQSAFGVLIYLLLAMAVLVAVVGGIGLMSTMSINVVERTREIGVMRSIGATSLAIVGIFVAEGVFVGTLSWLLAVPLSVPGAHLLSNAVGGAILEVPLDFAYSMNGMALWLLIVVVLSALASLWPALRAAQVSVREALAYE